MAQIGFALLAAHDNGATAEQLAAKLGLPVAWVAERIEAARLCVGAAGTGGWRTNP